MPPDSRTLLAIVAIVAVAVVYLGGMIAFVRLGKDAFKKTEKGAAKSFGLLFRRSIRFLTVATIILAVIVLALLDKLSEGAITLLAGVAGYVLGGMGMDSSQASDSE